MRRRGHTRITLLVAVMLLVSAVGAVAAVPDARLTVSDVTVVPATPVVGEQVTVSVSVANSVGSPDAARIDELELTDPVEDRTTRAQRLGGLSPGDSVTVPLAMTFETAGPRTLTLTVTGTDQDGDRVRVERPVPIAVEDAPPLIDVQVGDAVVDAETPVAVSLSNPTTADMRNIVVSVASVEGSAAVERASVATLPAGATEIRNLTVVPAATGETTAELRVNYTTAAGTERTRLVSVPLQVAEFDDDVQLTLRPIREDDDAAAAPDITSLLAGGAGGAGALGGGVTDGAGDDSTAPTGLFEVVVTNFGSAPVSDVVIEPTSAAESLPRLSIPGPIAPGESATATLDLSEVRQSGALTLTASYRVGTQLGGATKTIEYRPAVADLVVTDLDVRVDDGELRVLGNVANQGRGDAVGVVVKLADSETVQATYPQRDYFVGRVAPSDFAPFELTGSVGGEATNVTVVVRYTVDGVVVVRETVLDLPSGDQSGGFAVGGLVGGNVGSAGAVGAVGSAEKLDEESSSESKATGLGGPGTDGDAGTKAGFERSVTAKSVLAIVLVTALVLPVAAAVQLRRREASSEPVESR
ncbi:hypothetical protein C440_02053 [Haloferax mucosum ATCC BAA-1512]|uniref:CARDB domain-containing protein n=1 Tax=Haloferax mucosum ATCC BAA-1512 TaxID=662479 RepID=M0IPQ4_9EURY|nr:hypothetical protein [Haloferax mucosum]ELZ97992.1 hypothetical protein C440_02053 [Haloferax mucosum ATCC BAA-1512]